MTVLDSNATSRESGVLFRRGRPGPEQRLVEWFLEQGAVKPRRGERVTVFREPRLPSGFPDIVAVVWNESVTSEWHRSRRNLTATELRVLHHLVGTGPAKIADLELLFARDAERSLEMLLLARMVCFSKGQWRARPLSRIFATTRIVAVEAKIREWRSALDQAFLNTWFTPESYILIPSIPRRTALPEIAFQRGIGVLCKDCGECGLKRQLSRKPRSYASWLLNEWAWRVADP